MCIALISTAHPNYALILISNRDEYLTRPTAPAGWWDPPDSHVLGGRDLLRPEKGTWLGVTRTGLIAVLTNFKEEGSSDQSARSRGAMVNAFLTQAPGRFPDTATFVEDLVEGEEGLKGVGGFSLVCGKIGEALAIVSNRTSSAEGTTWVAQQRGKTVGLSNATFEDHTWPKVIDGERLLTSILDRHAQSLQPQTELIDDLFGLLSTNTLPKRPIPTAGSTKAEEWATYLQELRKSIFIPTIGGEGLLYGTQKQTVVLVSHTGLVTYVERTLFDENAKPTEEGKRDRWFEVEIEGWGKS